MEKQGGEVLEVIFLKLKNFLVDNAKIFSIVFLLIMLFSGLWMYKEYTGGSYEEKQIPSYTQYANYTYTTAVTQPNPLYPQGTILEMGQPAYFFSVSPSQDISFKYRLEAADSAALTVGLKTTVVALGKEGSGEEEKIFWQKAFPIGNPKTVQLKSGEAVTSNFTLDVLEMQSKAKEIQSQLNYSSEPSIELITSVDYQGKINGKDVRATKNFAVPINISSTYYQMPENPGFSEDTYENITVQKSSSLLKVKFPLALFLLSTVLIGILLPLRKMGKVDPSHIEKLEREKKKSSFKDLISTGKFPEDTKSFMKIEINSLQELVDAAIDMNERVIHDPASGAYFAIHNNAFYIFFDSSQEKG